MNTEPELPHDMYHRLRSELIEDISPLISEKVQILRAATPTIDDDTGEITNVTTDEQDKQIEEIEKTVLAIKQRYEEQLRIPIRMISEMKMTGRSISAAEAKLLLTIEARNQGSLFDGQGES